MSAGKTEHFASTIVWIERLTLTSQESRVDVMRHLVEIAEFEGHTAIAGSMRTRRRRDERGRFVPGWVATIRIIPRGRALGFAATVAFHGPFVRLP